MINSFSDLNLNSSIIEGLQKQGINIPTSIQSSSILPALEGKDIIGEAFTGSGKTLAYLLPLFHKIDTSKREMQGLILAPTHELAKQIEDQIKLLAENSSFPITSLSIIGDVNINNQIKKLKEIKPHIIVGSTGRILDLIRKKKITAHTIKTIVIDEGDNLLDPKRSNVTKDIVKSTMRDRQLMLFSASIKPETLETAKSLMKEPIIIKSEDKPLINPNIEHMFILCERRDKFETLRKVLVAVKPEKAIIFVNNNEDIELTTAKLNYHSKDCFAMTGKISKEDRKLAIESFRTGKIKILVSSDVTARGLDVADITHVFHLDLPLKLNEYLHRSGRTARGNAHGTSICILTVQQLNIIKKYEREFNIQFKEKKVFGGVLEDANYNSSSKQYEQKNKSYSSKFNK
ncbi:DEAD/DEAH box helicase [Clostridium beijerinckii]|jgi:Superfamily II DNA and RNA helicases|uniref:DEAD/DEAH box helicase n=2 Tax=Clostridium beijerinckii TaxID=1520 RepID=A0A1S8RVD6_CLOBE|nr:DEAD/DEAH box helicase [Clostridium beijerinckii]ABR33992.1 DEAD/DEAH box helicase domain protein [Clostridium beijerinckii NCIMB 8052]AIU02474.1 DEAD/DEAH box helicase domain-containing protein [Clostridium beijerinckii ATCC 35702]MBF7811403.1 DEAD/DEAH box helicase [Clostridium beijerinckii]NOW92155.1 superfamily II DNA/RNA helicase [Clostridium beijerinckii]NRT24715.1 superfamily II DNA/RNA helicase [Clostridium beijerinckii]